MFEITHCVLTGTKLTSGASSSGLVILYHCPLVGCVKITQPILYEYQQKNERHPVLAAICKNAYMRGEAPPIINSGFLNNELKTLAYPKTFAEKAKHLLKLLYDIGGNEFKPITLFPYNDYTACYAENQEEFERIMSALLKQGFIEWHLRPKIDGRYVDVTLTLDGINEVEKALPKIPMIGLVDQDIATGNVANDQKINHAKKLFFKDGATLEDMRSACVSLAAVLEPLRGDLGIAITSADINEFFQIVNRFDIRHNKAATINLVHPEQLEWVFYSLLNTINTYTKLKNRLG